MTETKQKTKKAQLGGKATGSRRFIVLSLITLGMYQVYWAWRAWETIRNAAQEEYAFKSSLCALFNGLSNFWLFPKMGDLAKEQGYSVNINTYVLASLFFAVGIVSRLPRIPTAVAIVGSLFVTTFTMVPIVEMHDYYIEKTKGAYTPSATNYWLLSLLVLLGIVALASIVLAIVDPHYTF
jgi:hypothetical protein